MTDEQLQALDTVVGMAQAFSHATPQQVEAVDVMVAYLNPWREARFQSKKKASRETQPCCAGITFHSSNCPKVR